MALLPGLTMMKSGSEAEKLYAPARWNRARDERTLYAKLFGIENVKKHTCSLLAYTSDSDNNLLEANAIKALRRIHNGILNLTFVDSSGDTEVLFSFKDICKRSDVVGYETNCSFVGVVELSDSEISSVPAGIFFNPKFGYIPVASFLGGRRQPQGSSYVEGASGLLLQYELEAATTSSTLKL
ncbi:hypothetical protein GUITHDRAFT_105583 [Guillardia theta CCMP2712]|uniref:Uncharacterized protein n=1 Tax=Guillardia theta (strain CCMP2712) TaxID=905079 RepID=L1JK15_GUITC|nr:hypothetical protein GUITHDRAFT_105583 [Guillardia theta CCMP2712]EKX48435.1 hypothetical protein GUITHDRAFT_105583 [Guillardia theta CCMP2712]|eukprot:XP_005835415.1 hypothetical protein GUITHDRAFT_105583 [Guillardia theta CCMP2712]